MSMESTSIANRSTPRPRSRMALCMYSWAVVFGTTHGRVLNEVLGESHLLVKAGINGIQICLQGCCPGPYCSGSNR